MVFWPPNGTPKSIKFASKTKSKKQQRWEPKFNGFRTNLGVENRPKNVPVWGKLISWKTLFLLGKTNVFQLWGAPEIVNLQLETRTWNRPLRNSKFHGFSEDFGLRNRPEKRRGTESVLRRYATHPHRGGSQPEPELLDYLSGYSYD